MVVGAGLFGKVVRRFGRSVSTWKTRTRTHGYGGQSAPGGGERLGAVWSLGRSLSGSAAACCCWELRGPRPPPPWVGTGRAWTGTAWTRVCWAGWVCCSSGWSRGECCRRSAGGRRGRGGSSPVQLAPWGCRGSGMGRGGSRSGCAARSLSSCKNIILIPLFIDKTFLPRARSWPEPVL